MPTVQVTGELTEQLRARAKQREREREREKATK
jgi:hypothetical protein